MLLEIYLDHCVFKKLHKMSAGTTPLLIIGVFPMMTVAYSLNAWLSATGTFFVLEKLKMVIYQSNVHVRSKAIRKSCIVFQWDNLLLDLHRNFHTYDRFIFFWDKKSSGSSKSSVQAIRYHHLFGFSFFWTGYNYSLSNCSLWPLLTYAGLYETFPSIMLSETKPFYCQL